MAGAPEYPPRFSILVISLISRSLLSQLALATGKRYAHPPWPHHVNSLGDLTISLGRRQLDCCLHPPRLSRVRHMNRLIGRGRGLLETRTWRASTRATYCKAREGEGDKSSRLRPPRKADGMRNPRGALLLVPRMLALVKADPKQSLSSRDVTFLTCSRVYSLHHQ